MTSSRGRLLTAALLGMALTDTPFGYAPPLQLRRQEDPPDPEPTQIGTPKRLKQARFRQQQENERLERLRQAADKRFRKAVKQVRLYQKKLRIEAAAIRDETGKVWQLPPPARHHHVIHVMAEAGLPTPIRGEQGFVTSYGSFVDRKTAAIIATAAEQLKNGSLTIHYDLYSEDVW